MMTRRPTLRKEYFDFLYNLVCTNRKKYVKLCEELHNKKFIWFVRNDDNRYEDGLQLREYFVAQHNLDESHLEVQGLFKGDCTVLEMMVALAQRMNYQLDTLGDSNNTNMYFLEMLENLKLDKFTDSYLGGERIDPISEAEIDDILETLINRTYGYDGEGSLFPLKTRGPKDMTKVEIWYQMMSYINEKYR